MAHKHPFFTLTPPVVFSPNSETRQSLESSLLFQLITDSLPIGFTCFTRISALRTEILQGRFLEVEDDCEDRDCHPTLLAFLFDVLRCVPMLSLVAKSEVEIV